MSNLLLSPTGRIGPASFLKGIAILAIIGAAVEILPLINFQIASLVKLLSVLLFVPLFFVVVKRLHDSGKSGWLSILFVVLIMIVTLALQMIVAPNFGGEATQAMQEGTREIALSDPSFSEMLAATTELTLEYGEKSTKELAIPKALLGIIGMLAGGFLTNLILKQDAGENQYGHVPSE